MVRPVEDEKELQNLQSIEDSKIRIEFREQAETLRNKVSKKVKPKLFNNKNLNGSMLIELLNSIIESINQGAVPVIENSWKYIIHNESVKNMNEIQKKFLISIKDFKEKNKDNTAFFQDLDSHVALIEKQLIEEFKKFTIMDDITENEYSLKLKGKFTDELKKFNEENSKFFEGKLLEGLEKNSKKLIDTFETEKYSKNYYQFFRDLENLKEITEASTPEFPMKKEIIFEKIILIIKKFIEMNYLKNKMSNEREMATLRNEVQNTNNKIKIKSEEHEIFKIESKQKIEKLNNQINEFKLKEKSLEDKLRSLEVDKNNSLINQDKKYIEMKNELTEIIEIYKKEIVKFDSELKTKQDQIMTMKFAEEKMTSLSNMKIEFFEKENSNHKERYENIKKENSDYRSTIEELTIKIEELKLENKSKRALELEIERLKVKEMTNKTQRWDQNDTISQKNSCEFDKKNLEIISLLGNSLDLSKGQFEETKKMIRELLSKVIEINNNSFDDEKTKLIESNKVNIINN